MNSKRTKEQKLAQKEGIAAYKLYKSCDFPVVNRCVYGPDKLYFFPDGTSADDEVNEDFITQRNKERIKFGLPLLRYRKS